MASERTAEMWIGLSKVGTAGELTSRVATTYEISTRVCVAEVNLSAIIKEAQFDYRTTPPSRFPPVRRDLAFVLDRSVDAMEIANTSWDLKLADLYGLSFFDEYEGKGIEEGKKSVALRLEFRHADRTLTEDEVQAEVEKVVDAVKGRWGAVLRA
jgi:phenylalanyl-tRNA synthetase beta chain